MNKIEDAQNSLIEDLKNYPRVTHDPIGDARTCHKIQHYLFLSIIEGKSKSESVDWLYGLYKEQTDNESGLFRGRIDLLANTLYDFYHFLNNKQQK